MTSELLGLERGERIKQFRKLLQVRNTYMKLSNVSKAFAKLSLKE